jgi:hypothetical protein
MRVVESDVVEGKDDVGLVRAYGLHLRLAARQRLLLGYTMEK